MTHPRTVQPLTHRRNYARTTHHTVPIGSGTTHSTRADGTWIGLSKVDHPVRTVREPRETLDSLVGLTRIELVTSSLSGMRSNQLSYSPELFSGHMSLLPLSVTLNRGNQNLFFQHRHPNSAYKIGNEVEHCCTKHPHNGEQCHKQ